MRPADPSLAGSADGVRVVRLNAAGMPQTPQLSDVHGLHADAYGISRDAFRARMADRTLRKQLPTVAEIANMPLSSPRTGPAR